jgi:hypothetical protein
MEAANKCTQKVSFCFVVLQQKNVRLFMSSCRKACVRIDKDYQENVSCAQILQNIVLGDRIHRSYSHAKSPKCIIAMLLLTACCALYCFDFFFLFTTMTVIVSCLLGIHVWMTDGDFMPTCNLLLFVYCAIFAFAWNEKNVCAGSSGSLVREGCIHIHREASERVYRPGLTSPTTSMHMLKRISIRHNPIPQHMSTEKSASHERGRAFPKHLAIRNLKVRKCGSIYTKTFHGYKNCPRPHKTEARKYKNKHEARKGLSVS